MSWRAGITTGDSMVKPFDCSTAAIVNGDIYLTLKRRVLVRKIERPSSTSWYSVRAKGPNGIYTAVGRPFKSRALALKRAHEIDWLGNYHRSR